MTTLLGIDYGTSHIKSELFLPDGKQLARQSAQLEVNSPNPGWVEQDPEIGWRLVCSAIKAVLDQAGISPRDVSAVTTTGTSNITLFDQAGRILRPAILYGDTRLPSREKIQTILSQLGENRVGAAFGFTEVDDDKIAIILRTLTTSKLLWISENEANVFRQVKSCTSTGFDFINARLTGEATYLADNYVLDQMIAELFQIPSTWFGRPCRVGEIVGVVSAEAAGQCSLLPGIPVVMGAGDSPCTFLGAGLSRPGMAINNAGTTDVVAVTTAGLKASQVGYPVPHLIPDLGLISLSPIRGPAHRWFRDLLLPPESSFADLDRLAALAPPGAEGLLCLPYFSGEKGLVHDPVARGVIAGLSDYHSPAHLARSILEGIAYGIRQILEAYQAEHHEFSEIRLTGGGARSMFWNQMKANVLGRPVHILQIPETGCLGAALLSAVTLGYYPDIRSACDAMVAVGTEISPQPKESEIYNQTYPVYQSLYPANQAIFKSLSSIRT